MPAATTSDLKIGSLATFTVAQDIDGVQNRNKIEWKLITDLPVTARGRHSKTRMACHAMENRGVPQDPQIGLQS
jgi:hypothetical protein